MSSRAAPAHASATGQEEAQSPQANGGPPQLDADEFSGMLETLREWKHQYYDCNVPRRVSCGLAPPLPPRSPCKPVQGYLCPMACLWPVNRCAAAISPPVATQVHDAPELGEWVHHMRGLRRRGQLPPAAEQQLEALGFSWDLDVVTAKWYHNLHAARQYRVRRWERWQSWLAGLPDRPVCRGAAPGWLAPASVEAASTLSTGLLACPSTCRRCMAAATSRQTLLMLLTPTGWRLRAGWSGSETCTAARSCCWCGCDSSSSYWVSGVGRGAVGWA